MFKELAELYLNQGRHVDLFKLYLQQGYLEQALSIPFNDATAHEIPEQRLLEVLDYVAAEQYLRYTISPSAGIGFDLPEVLKTNAVRGRLGQWNIGLRKRWAPPAEGKSPDQTLLELQHTDIKQFIGLQVS